MKKNETKQKHHHQEQAEQDGINGKIFMNVDASRKQFSKQ